MKRGTSRIEETLSRSIFEETKHPSGCLEMLGCRSCQKLAKDMNWEGNVRSCDMKVWALVLGQSEVQRGCQKWYIEAEEQLPLLASEDSKMIIIRRRVEKDLIRCFSSQ